VTSLWQLTNGRKFAQLIFNGESLVDCEFLKDGGDVASEFVDKFIEEYNSIRHQRNSDFGYANHHQYHESSNLAGSALSIKPNATVLHLKRLQEIPERFLGLMNLKKLQKKCNQLHKQIRQSIQHESMDEDDDMETDFEDASANGR
jgi:hypothetical protein